MRWSAMIVAMVCVAADWPERVAFTALSPTEESRRAALAQYGMARRLALREQLPEAAKRYESVVRTDATAVAPSRELVRVYIDLGRDAAALRMAKQVVEREPADAETAHTLGKLLYEAKRYREAATVLTAATASPQLATRQTKALAIRKDAARASDAATDWPTATTAWQSVIAYLEAQQNALLKRGFSANELDRERAEAYEKLGRTQRERKQIDEAIRSYQQAHELYADAKRANDAAGAARLDWNLSELHAAGDTAKSLAALTRYLARKPLSPAPYERLAELLRTTGRAVVPTLRALSAEQPDNAAIQWVLLAERSREMGTFDDAHAMWLALAATTNDPAFFRLLVQSYAKAEQPAQLLMVADTLFPMKADAEKKPADVPPKTVERQQAFASAFLAETGFATRLLRAVKAAPADPHSPQVWDLLMAIADRSGNANDAEAALRAAAKQGDRQAGMRSFLRLYRFLYRQRKWEEILSLRGDPVLANRIPAKSWNYFLASPYAELGLAEQAEAAIQDAETEFRFDAIRERAQVLGILGKYAAMRKICDEMLLEFTAPEQVQSVRYLRSDAFNGLKQFDKAEQELRGILDEDPDDVLALNNLGYNLADQNRGLVEAEQLIRRAIELDRDERARAGEANLEHAAYLDSLGWVLFRRGKLTEAREWLEKAAIMPEGSTDPTVWDHLGDVCMRQGDKARAKTAWANAAARYIGTQQGRHLGRMDEAKRKLKLVE